MLLSSIRAFLTTASQRLSAASRDNLAYRTTLIERLICAKLSRRDALQLSLTAALAAPLFGPLARAASRFEIDAQQPGRIAIRIGETTLFEVRTDQFDGPKSSLVARNQSGKHFSIQLKHAFFPGTAVAADFELSAIHTDIGWQARLVWPALGFDASFAFEQWLLGFPVAVSPIQVQPLLSMLNVSSVRALDAQAVFLPTWTFEVHLAREAHLNMAAGNVATSFLQIELIAKNEIPLLLLGSLARTRLWVLGQLFSSPTVRFEHYQATFASGQIESVVETACNARPAWAMESRGTERSAGFIVPHKIPNAYMVGFAASQLRVINLGSNQNYAQATLNTQKKWYSASGISIEITARHTFLHGDLAQLNPFRVSRMIVPLTGVDQAVFVRMYRNGTLAPFSQQVDSLEWFDGVHIFGRTVPLDDFELRITRGSDVLNLVVRFHDIRLKASGSNRVLIGGPQARIEFAFGSQHANEDALYVSQLLDREAGQPGNGDDQYVSDTEICAGLTPPLVDSAMCEQHMDQARKSFGYERLRQAAIAERAKKPAVPPTAHARARFADATWLTFAWPPREGRQERRMSLTLEALLSWAVIAPETTENAQGMRLLLHPNALPEDMPVQRQLESSKQLARAPKSLREAISGALNEYATLIQAPYRLGLSPIGEHCWRVAPAIETEPGVKQLWTVRTERIALRAIWSPDYTGEFWPQNYPHYPLPECSFRAPLDARDRHEIVALSSRFGEPALIGSAQVLPYTFAPGSAPQPGSDQEIGLFVPKPIQAQLLLLSAYGASLRLKANWAPPASVNNGALTVQFWDQNSQLGRDTRVIVEYKGFLFPLGQPATLIKDTQRRLVKINRSYHARLVQRFYIKVPALTRTIPALQQPFEGRGWPFATLHTQDYISPDLGPPEKTPFDDTNKVLGQQAFWPSLASTGALVEFPFEDPATGISARAPQLFIDNEVAHNSAVLKVVVQSYRAQLLELHTPVQGRDDYGLRDTSQDGHPRRCVAQIDSGAIRFAPEVKPGTTRFKASCFLLDVDVPGAVEVPAPTGGTFPPAVSADDPLQQALRFSSSMEAQNQPPFYPHLRQALVSIGTVATLSSKHINESRAEIDGHYLRNGFDSANNGEIYLRLVDDKTKLAFSDNTSNAGGFANTSTIIAALSRRDGPIGGAGPLLPQQDCYRYVHSICINGNESISTALQGGPVTPMRPDPVANARRGVANPREFFGQTLGEAKLCGVVAFADIIDSVVQTAEARAPRLMQELEHAIPEKAIKEVALKLRAALKPLIDALTQPAPNMLAVPTLQSSALKLDALLAQVAHTKGATLLPLTSDIASQAKALRDEVSTVTQNPGLLIPDEVQAQLKPLFALKDALLTLMSPDGVKKLLGLLLTNLQAAAGIPALRALEEALKGDARFKALQQHASNAREALESLEWSAKEGPQSLLAMVPLTTSRLFESFDELNAWSLWVDDPSQKLRWRLDAFAQSMLEAVQEKVRLNQLVEAAQSLKNSADRLKNTRPSARDVIIDQAVLELSEIALAAIAHADAAATAANLYKEKKAFDERANLLANYLRVHLDVLSKTPRLLLLEQKAQGVASFTETYRQWVIYILEHSLRPTLKTLIEKLANDDPEIAPALTWMNALLQRAQHAVEDLINAAHDTSGVLALHKLAENVGKGDLLYSLNALLVAALDPARMAGAFAKARTVLRAPVYTALQEVCTHLKEMLKQLTQTTSELGDKNSSAYKWLAPELRAAIGELKVKLENLSALPSSDEQQIKGFFNAFDSVRMRASAVLQDVAGITTSGNLAGLVDLQTALDSALEIIGIPSSARLKYEWQTEVNPYPAGSGPVFEPMDNRQLTIQSVLEADLRGNSPPKFSTKARLDAFKINLFGATPFLCIVFEPLTFVAESGKPADLGVKIRQVDFSGALSFVKNLQEYLKENFGLIIAPRSDGPGVIVGYSFNKPLINTAAFQLQNVGFTISCLLPFDSEPARFRFGLADPDKPFLLSAGIYGGGGHVAIQSRADTLESLDASFEYGLVTAFQFGPAVGSGKITAGIYLRLAAREATLSGFFNASGLATIAGLVTVTAEFRVQLWYDIISGRAAGAATFSVSFSIGFLDYEYKVGVAYAAKGDTENKNSARGHALSQVPEPHSTEQSALMDIMHDLAVPNADGSALVAERYQIAQHIEPSPNEHLNDCLLEPELWQDYWAAFEDVTDGCA